MHWFVLNVFFCVPGCTTVGCRISPGTLWTKTTRNEPGKGKRTSSYHSDFSRLTLFDLFSICFRCVFDVFSICFRSVFDLFSICFCSNQAAASESVVSVSRNQRRGRRHGDTSGARPTGVRQVRSDSFVQYVGPIYTVQRYSLKIFLLFRYHPTSGKSCLVFPILWPMILFYVLKVLYLKSIHTDWTSMFEIIFHWWPYTLIEHLCSK